MHSLWDDCDSKHHNPRRPLTKEIIQAISVLQFDLKRAPSRPEVLDYLAIHCGDLNHEGDPQGISIDESELCRQLKRLGWQDLLTPANELAS